MRTLEGLKELGCEIYPVGSRRTCDPPPTDTDDDYLVYIPVEDIGTQKKREMTNHVNGEIIKGNYKQTTRYFHAEQYFTAYRWYDINLIVSCDPQFKRDFLRGTEVCKERNVLDKTERVRIFENIRQYGDPDYVEPEPEIPWGDTRNLNDEARMFYRVENNRIVLTPLPRNA